MSDPAASASPGTAGPPSLRSDAQRNLDRVMEQAMRLFSERGSDVSVAEVAAAAGVGKATVYRSFPTKDALLEAVALRRLAWFNRRLDEAATEPAPWAAFASLVHDLSARLERDRTLGQVLREIPAGPAMHDAKADVRRALQFVIDRAIAAGAMRTDAQAADVAHLLSGYAFALTRADAPASDWERLAGLVVDAFRVRST